MYQTLELGPILNISAPDFSVRDHSQQKVSLDDVIGVWLQRHAGVFMRAGVNLAMVICDQPHTLYGFRVSSPLPLEFPLLADVDHAIHGLYNMDDLCGLVMLDSSRTIRHKWLVPDERVWPNVNELLDAAKLMR
jgi:peroxiredoxin